MTRHAVDEGVFIRSMGTRGSLGGLAQATRDTARVLDAAGYGVIVIETVGVGQSEIDIMHMADSVALVLTPGAGDTVQVFKAGIMEIADIFVVNKADLTGAKKVVKELEEMLHIAYADNSPGWFPRSSPPSVQKTMGLMPCGARWRIIARTWKRVGSGKSVVNIILSKKCCV